MELLEKDDLGLQYDLSEEQENKEIVRRYRALLRGLKEFEALNCPILVGVSRKSMICKLLGVNPENALNGTTAVNTLAVLNGAHILRVHDVREAVETIKVVKAFGK